jgi:hypothetical protein
MRKLTLPLLICLIAGCKSVPEQQSYCASTYADFQSFALCMHRSKGSWEAGSGSGQWADYFKRLDALSARVKTGEISDAEARKQIDQLLPP